MKLAEIRQKFLDYFKEKGHQIVPSAPIVLKNDPTLLFTNAGMNQFKDYFLGNENPVNTRIADTQKCLRVSGKHNDLEEVGKDTYHHTMFEMLGNWSFGDYFKEEAIDWAWDLLVNAYGLNKTNLYVTVFEGDEKDGVPQDKEAAVHWLKYVDQSRLLKFGKKDNFWEMGETGPCGPSSEIHIDLREEEEKDKVPGADLVNKGHPLVIEIWNLVFIQYNRFKDGHLESLPQKHIDTGMGLERLVAIIQNKKSNYDTDIFQPIIQSVADLYHVKYGEDENTDIALRVIADHCRAVSFAIADGQLPSNNGAGYVIRRILRRAIRYAYQFLGANEAFIYSLTSILVEQFQDVFPEIKKQEDFIKNVIHEEEKSFLKTLETGIKLFEEKTSAEKNMVAGKFAFELYDTYGFPFDLTRLMATEKGLKVDEKQFNIELSKQKERSRKVAEQDTGDWNIIHEGQNSHFVGYDQLESKTYILRYREINQKGRQYFQIVLEETPFYAEGGGQVGDSGVIVSGDAEIEVFDTKKENELFISFVSELPKSINEPVLAKVNVGRRKDTMRNHSATHLMHEALKRILGEHVEQKGSLVNEKYLRFDFSHFQKMTDKEIEKVEYLVNEKIRENIHLKEEREVPFAKAVESGATALFGEKYGDSVRIITFDDNYSKELCGGTHVQASGEIGFFKITSESAVAAGIRRIEAVTGTEATSLILADEKELSHIKRLTKNPTNPASAIEELIEENKKQAKRIQQLEQKQAMNVKDELISEALEVGKVKLIIKQLDLPNPSLGKELVFSIKDSIPESIVLIGSSFDKKVNLWMALGEDALEFGINAGNVIKEISSIVRGGGGGQAFFASAGGSLPEKLEDALKEGKKIILDKLKEEK